MLLLRPQKNDLSQRNLHITVQFLDMAGAHSQWNLFHITFGACMRFKSNAFSLKYSLQKIYHTYSGYLKLSKGNINRFFSKNAFWSTGEIKSFLWKARNWNYSGVLKPRGTYPVWLEFLAASDIEVVFIWVYVYWMLFLPLWMVFSFRHLQCFEEYLCSLIVQLVKNLPAVQETPVWFLCWEDTLEKGQATHSRILRLPSWLRR